jgi:hypothetical protein
MVPHLVDGARVFYNMQMIPFFCLKMIWKFLDTFFCE